MSEAIKEIENMDLVEHCEIQHNGIYDDIEIAWDGLAAMVLGVTANRLVKYIMNKLNYEITDDATMYWNTDEIMLCNLTRRA